VPPEPVKVPLRTEAALAAAHFLDGLLVDPAEAAEAMARADPREPEYIQVPPLFGPDEFVQARKIA
jgi:hypothetical protein